MEKISKGKQQGASKTMKKALFVGDVQLGRLLDAGFLPYPIKNEIENGRDMSKIGAALRSQYFAKDTAPEDYFLRLFGDTLSVLNTAKVFLNLEVVSCILPTILS
jgi:hypothetical protein